MNRPLMEYMVEKLREAGFGRIIVLLGYLPKMVKEHFGDGESFGVEIEYIEGNTAYGTAGAVRRAAEHLEDSFLVVSADVVTEISLRKFMKFYGEKEGRVNIALSRVERPYHYGIALVDDNDRVYKFLEKPKKSQVFSNLVNTGLYIFEPEIMELIPPKKNFDFSKDLFPLLLRKGEPIYGYKFSEYWADIGTPKRYLTATRDAMDGKIDLNKIKGDWGMNVDNGLVIGEHCSVDEDIEINGFAILGDNVNIGEGSRLSDSVIWPNTHIGRGVSIEESIIGENVRIFSDVNIVKGSMVQDNQWIWC
jgi:mannose-1-phosphate guanylyltransferase